MQLQKNLIGAIALAMMLTAAVASAQTTTTTGTTPAVPNTGAGGDTAANVVVLAGSALAALAGATYLGRSRAASR